MTDTNRSRELQTQRFRRNKQAFDEIFGDPFAHPEPIEGEYQQLRKRSSMLTQQLDRGESRTAANPARPSITDFFCDAERIVAIAAEKHGPGFTERFTAAYIHETSNNAFTSKERTALEQHIGRLLLAYGISPTSKYFRAIKRKRNTNSS